MRGRPDGPATHYLAVRYLCRPARPVRTGHSNCGCGDGCETSRLRDDFELCLRSELEGPYAPERTKEEKEWLECGFPKKMLDYIQGRLDQRKQRLLACVCVRSVWHNLRDERFRVFVELSEDYADGRATAEQLDLTARHLFEVASRTNFLLVLTEPPVSAMAAAMSVGNRNISMCLEGARKNSLLSAAPCILRPNEEGPSHPDDAICVLAGA